MRLPLLSCYLFVLRLDLAAGSGVNGLLLVAYAAFLSSGIHLVVAVLGPEVADGRRAWPSRVG